jgi:PLP dependent protein
VAQIDRPAYPQAVTLGDFQRNLARVVERIEAACRRAGRDPGSVRLLPVSKTVAEAQIRLSYAAGCRMLGENKVQEAGRKAGAMRDLSDLRWSVIGHLQTKKAKLVARFAHEFQALDSCIWRRSSTAAFRRKAVAWTSSCRSIHRGRPASTACLPAR